MKYAASSENIERFFAKALLDPALTVYGIWSKIEHVAHVICYFCEVLYYLWSSIVESQPQFSSLYISRCNCGYCGRNVPTDQVNFCN
jgi:hypothetical protein